MGPHTALGDIPRSIELLAYLERHGLRVADARRDAVDEWTAFVREKGEGPLATAGRRRSTASGATAWPPAATVSWSSRSHALSRIGCPRQHWRPSELGAVPPGDATVEQRAH
jgi:hypothetical protein